MSGINPLGGFSAGSLGNNNFSTGAFGINSSGNNNNNNNINNNNINNNFNNNSINNNTIGKDQSNKKINLSLKELLETSRNLPKRSNDIGNIHLSLNEISRKANDLRKYNKNGNNLNPYTKAHYLLVGSGVTIEDVNDELESIQNQIPSIDNTNNNNTNNNIENDKNSYFKNIISTQKFNKKDEIQNDNTNNNIINNNNSNISNVKDSNNNNDNNNLITKKNQKSNNFFNVNNINGDIDNYINNKKDENILSAIEQSLVSAARDFDSFVNSNITMDWNLRKEELRDSLSNILKKGKPSSELTKSSINNKSLTTSSSTTTTENENALNWGDNNYKSLISSKFDFDDVTENLNDLKNLSKPNFSFSLRQRFEIYAQVIYELNDSRQFNKNYPLATVFTDLSKKEINSKSKILHESWNILREFVDDNDNNNNERKFAKGYCTNDLTNIDSINLRKRIIFKGKNYLEDQFVDYINEIYMKSDIAIKNKVKSIASVSIIDKIKTYIDLTLKKSDSTAGSNATATATAAATSNTTTSKPNESNSTDGKKPDTIIINDNWKIPHLSIINGTAIWPIIFYLLRCGYLEEAVKFVESNDDYFTKLERFFPIYLKSYASSIDNKLPNELQGRLNNEFNQYFKHINKDIDPFKYSVYKIIGRCDLARKNLPASITLNVEDWLWVQLSLIREDESLISTISGNNTIDEPILERYSLNDLQKSILEFGKDSFNSSNNNPMYLQTLILTGLYENAVQYLFEVSEIDSVHLSITLSYYGLLRVKIPKLIGTISNNSNNNRGNNNNNNSTNDKLLDIDQNGFKVINYSRLIGYYVRTFKISDPRVALEYLICIFLCEYLTPQIKNEQIKIGQEAIRELVLETREFVMLLGRIEKDGNRLPGAIEERKKLLYLNNEENYLYQIAEQAAIKAEEEGRLYDCILLYQLSEEYETVINLVIKLLGEFLVSIDINISIDDLLNKNINNNNNTTTSTTNDSTFLSLKNDDINIISLSLKLIKLYNNSIEISNKVSIKSKEILSVLLEIYEIRKEFNKYNPNLVKILNKLENLNLLPINFTRLIELEEIRKLSIEFNSINESIAKNIPNLLIISMKCISQLIFDLNQGLISESILIDSSNNSLLINSTKDEKIIKLRQISRNLMIYSGMLQYKMPRDVYTTLINIEVNI
ncbi:hypothetical protein B5S32_g3269 [[Candida] boidinii]|nr:hypothetical protein B5S32_g3269 [[Candida] boidinii]